MSRRRRSPRRNFGTPVSVYLIGVGLTIFVVGIFFVFNLIK
jgi:hypothetical protein